MRPRSIPSQAVESIDGRAPTKGAAHLWPALGAALALLGVLLAASSYNYLLFHSFAEMFGLVVACGTFVFVWNSRQFLDNNYLLLTGIGLLFIGALHLVHALAYKGMGVFPGDDPNLATQLWIATRYLAALTLLIAPWWLNRRLQLGWAFAAFAAVTAAIVLSIFIWPVFPDCFVAASQTTFKRASEFVISAIFIAAAVRLYGCRTHFAPEVLRLLLASIFFGVLGELAFTLYRDVYGLANFAGHYLVIISFYCIYKAVLETGLRRPYDLVFRRLMVTQQQLEELNETLEQKVAQRTAQLKELAGQLAQAEHRERRRVAGILHDHVQQLIAAARMRAALVRSRGPQANPELLDRLIELLDEAITAVRGLSIELSPPVLAERGLAAALEWLAEDVHEKHGLQVQAGLDTSVEPAGSELADFLFQAVREMLFNVVKHAGVGHAEVHLEQAGEDSLRLAVTDQGRGFAHSVENHPPPRKNGFGLANIRERLSVFGGELAVQSAPGQGTRITITAPMRPAHATAGRLEPPGVGP